MKMVLGPSSFDFLPSTPLLSQSESFSSSSSSPESLCNSDANSPDSPLSLKLRGAAFPFPAKNLSGFFTYRELAVLSGHVGSVSCLAQCGEFILSASQGNDIIVWQQPDMKIFSKFGQGDGAVKAVVAVEDKVFTAHQDSKLRLWKVSRSSENVFKLADTLPTTKDVLGKFMNQRNYVEVRRHHKKLWIEHADSISCLALSDGMIYSGSWDKTIKVWRLSDLKCLESINAHGDAINAMVACKGVVYSGSADGKIMAWGRENRDSSTKHFLKGVLESRKNVSITSVVASDDGKWVYGGASDGFMLGWEGCGGLTKWKLVCEMEAHKMAVLCLCLKGHFLCSGSADKTIAIWRREAYGKISKIAAVRGHEGPVKCLQTSPNSVGGGFLLYSGGLDKTLRVWWMPNNPPEVDDDPPTLVTEGNPRCFLQS